MSFPHLSSLMLIFCLAAMIPAQDPALRVVTPQVDNTTVLRNPACGWVLYLDAVGRYPDADAYWQQLDPYVAKASIFYHRARWSDYEPEEGRYAWEHDTRLRRMLQHARERGLKLAFRVLVDSRDNAAQTTPDYVRLAGARGHDEQGQDGKRYWNPDLDDAIFQRKLERFVTAFAKAFDDPSQVDFIDGCGLGWWGECHHLGIPAEKRAAVYEWICATYGNAFKRVLLTTPVGGEFGLDLDARIAIARHGYIARRDGLGSRWFSRSEKDFLRARFPALPLIGESCYFSVKSWRDPWQDEPGMKTHRDILAWTVRDALDHHANTLDLRNPIDARTWVEDAPELVQRFIAEGGYRLAPTEVRFPATARSGVAFTIRHTWRNAGVGVLPNANPRWGRKFRIAFALFPAGADRPMVVQVDRVLDPGDCVRRRDLTGDSIVTCPAGWTGTCDLGVAIVDTANGDVPALRLAITAATLRHGWSMLGTIRIAP